MKIIYAENRRDLAKHFRNMLWQHHQRRPFSRGFFIVPESEKANIERQYFAENTDRSLMLEEILSFQRFSLRISELTGRGNYSKSNPAIESYLLSDLINELEDDLKSMAQANEKPAYLNRIKDVLGDLWRFEVSVDDLRNISAEAEKGLDINFVNKLEDLALLLDKYEEKLSQYSLVPADLRLENLSDTLWELIEKLAEVSGDYSQLDFPYNNFAFLKETSIYIYGFGIDRSFTPQEERIVQALDLLCHEVIVAVEADFVPGNMDEIEQGKRQFTAGRRQIYSFAHNYKDVEIEQLQAADKTLARREFHVFEKEQEEARFVAAKIKELLYQEQDIKPQNIGIALASPRQQLNMRLALEELSLPFYTQDPGKLDYALFENYVKRLIDIIRYPDDFSMVIEYIKNPYSGLEPLEQDQLIDFWLARGFEGYEVWTDEKYQDLYRPGELSVNVEIAEDEDVEETETENLDISTVSKRTARANEYRDRALSKLSALIASTRTKQSLGSFSHAIINFLDESGLEDKLATKVSDLLLAAKRDEAEIESKSWNNFLESLETFIRLDVVREITLSDYLYYLEEAYLANKKSRIPATGNQIVMGSMKQLAKEEVDVVFLIGADQSTIPQSADKISLLNSVDRVKMNEVLDINLPDPQGQLLNANESDFYGVLALPEKYVYVSYTGTVDEESNKLKRLRSVWNADLVEHEEVSDLLDPQLTKPERAWAWYKSTGVDSDLSLVKALRDYLAEYKPASLEIWASEVSTREMTKYGTLKLESSLVQRMLGENPLWSISQLEKYRTNPFSYYVEYLLRLRSKQIYKPDASSYGTLVHKVMELAQDDWEVELSASSNPEERQEILKSILDDVNTEQIQTYLLKGADEDENLEIFWQPGSPYASRYKAFLTSYQGSKAQIRELLSTDVEWKPYASEWKFGFAGHGEYAVKFGEDQQLELRGLIDRVDTVDIGEGETRFRILDYKTGNKKVSYARLYYGFDLQLPIYLSAFESLNQGYIANDAGYAYMGTHSFKDKQYREYTEEEFLRKSDSNFKISTIDLDEETLHLVMRHVEERAVEIANNILDGDFSVAPRTDSANVDPLRFIDYRALAQVDRGYIRVGYEPQLEGLARDIDPEETAKVRGNGRNQKDKGHIRIILEDKYGVEDEQ